MTPTSYRGTPATTTATAHGTVRHARHHLNLPHARTVTTSPLSAAAAALRTTFAQHGMMCLTAPAGVGKTFTLHTVLDDNPHMQAIRILPRPQARPQDLRHSLHHALGLSGQPPDDCGTSDDLVRHALHHPVRLLAIDEAHQLSATCLEYLRYLCDDPRTQFALLLTAGSHRIRALRATAMLAARITCWHSLDLLDRADIPTTIAAFHPHWKTADPAVLLHLDQRWAHGNFRRWATVTHRSISIQHRTGQPTADPDALLRHLVPGAQTR